MKYAFVSLDFVAHPLQQRRILHGPCSLAEIGAAGQAHLHLAGAVLHRVGEAAVGFEDNAGEALMVGSADIDGQSGEQGREDEDAG